MIKKKIALLLTCVSLTFPVQGVLAAENVREDKVPINQNISNDKIHSGKEKLDIMCKEGKIVSLLETKQGIMMQMSDINIFLDDKSEIIDEFSGEKLTKSDLIEGTKVRVLYGPAVTLSIPPMSYGRKIMVINDYKGIDRSKQTVEKVVKFNDGNNAYIKSKYNENITLISSKTEIINENGEKSSIDDIKSRYNIRLYINEKEGILSSKLYLPTIYVPQKVVILGKEKENLLNTEGNISNIKNNNQGKSFLLKGEKITESGYDKIILNVDSHTKIIDGKNNKELSINDLKDGIRILGYYDKMVTRSMPPIGNCKEIIVLE
ncbi:hypothetical protein [Clostridium rectalis]|uniref:hypothetical protein n=1 Tax=Clostridium rectalis TaxID=2040295 RepID=UPI000F63CDFF|nr:hypothetical protein [Clostridium rectalis]